VKGSGRPRILRPTAGRTQKAAPTSVAATSHHRDLRGRRPATRPSRRWRDCASMAPAVDGAPRTRGSPHLPDRLIGIDLLAWTRTLLLDGEHTVAEPKKLRYRLLHVPPRIVRTARRTYLRIAQRWAMGPEPGHRLRPPRRVAMTNQLNPNPRHRLQGNTGESRTAAGHDPSHPTGPTHAEIKLPPPTALLKDRGSSGTRCGRGPAEGFDRLGVAGDPVFGERPGVPRPTPHEVTTSPTATTNKPQQQPLVGALPSRVACAHVRGPGHVHISNCSHQGLMLCSFCPWRYRCPRYLPHQGRSRTWNR
jgi:hypothetical protein